MAQLITVTQVAPFPDGRLTGGSVTIAVANIQFITDNIPNAVNNYGDKSTGVSRIVYKRTHKNHLLTSIMYVTESRPTIITAAG